MSIEFFNKLDFEIAEIMCDFKLVKTSNSY